MSEPLTKCDVCRGLIDEEDLFCSNCGTEAPHQETTEAAATQTVTHNFECRGCGASMSYDASAGTLRCPFCGSEHLEQTESSKTLAAEHAVPFVVERDAADAKMRQWLGRGFWRPGDLSQRAAVVSMTPVYVPYWSFQGKTHTYWTADTSQVDTWCSGVWKPMTGEHRGQHHALLVGASGALTPSETHALCPFDMIPSLPPDQIDFENFTTEKFSVPRKYAREQARIGLDHLEASICAREYVPPRTRNVKANVLTEGLQSKPVLLPIWIMAYRYKGKVFRFLMNGQTGRSIWQVPFSYKKLFLIAGGIVAALILLMLILSK